MGFEIGRFQGEVDEELICSICGGVLEDPVQAPHCEHAFCRECIHEWLSRQSTCPVDRQAISSAQLKNVPRILRNLLSRLNIGCNHSSYGCLVIVKLDQLPSHLQECEHNPKRPVPCEQGCGQVIPKNELKEHNCVRDLRNMIASQQNKIETLHNEIREQQTGMNELKREMLLLKDFVRLMRVSNPQLRAITDQMEQDEVVRWTQSLPVARVTRWGGMISTPDAVLQAVIKRALLDTGCPQHIVNVLMENAHERKWPVGLNTLETRQMNRRDYERYMCRRIPGKQAVAVMACDNQHMPTGEGSNNMLVEPGLVMIFAHGIE